MPVALSGNINLPIAPEHQPHLQKQPDLSNSRELKLDTSGLQISKLDLHHFSKAIKQRKDQAAQNNANQQQIYIMVEEKNNQTNDFINLNTSNSDDENDGRENAEENNNG